MKMSYYLYLSDDGAVLSTQDTRIMFIGLSKSFSNFCVIIKGVCNLWSKFTGIYIICNEKLSEFEESETHRSTIEIVMPITFKDKILIITNIFTSKIKFKYLNSIIRTSNPTPILTPTRLSVYHKKIKPTNIIIVTIEHKCKKL